jgi:hypothetical protein
MTPNDDDEANVPLIAASSHTTLPDEHANRGSADGDKSAGAPGSAKRHSRFREEMDDTHENVYAEREGLRRADSGEGGEEHEDTEGEVDESKMLRPGVFVWCLTLCAGVSGLLFGYEYVRLLLHMKCTCWGKGNWKQRRCCSTLWYERTMRSTS